MIWYALYPFRGTTEPPRLDPKHPLRKAFERHGTATAEHWLLSILFTVALSVLLCYPVLFHQDSAAATRFRNLPKHVWTSTTAVKGDEVADVDMRQVWVHGDFMKAIDHRVLQQALSVQEALIADGFDDGKSGTAVDEGGHWPGHDGCGPDAMRGISWGFHSPLMYWNCSADALASDPNPLDTINAVSGRQSYLNFTLRPSTVFAGKAFTNSKLQAADALVLTLFDRTVSKVENIWVSRATSLAQSLPSGWSMYPPDGRASSSRLYKFVFRHMSFIDDFTLAVIYCAIVAFVLLRMRQLRAVKSRFGLLLAILFKMTASVIASFTVCSFLQIKLTRIPREFFPFVVMFFGLGNIFRLMNEVLKLPPETPPVQRIANAIGEIGHLSLAQAVWNLTVLGLLSLFSVPGVSEFCTFAAVILVFDFVFHLTFFLAVLSVDVQRMELQDSLERVDLRQASSTSQKQDRQSWLGALRQGQLPFSTRLAGSAALVSFIMGLNWHFDNESQAFSLRRFLSRLSTKQFVGSAASQWDTPPINQARTPAEWLELQDHNTAKEMIGFVKPGADRFVARVYDPLIVFMDDAYGRTTVQKSNDWLEFFRRFSHLHFYPAALIVVFTIAFVTLLMNYLLWNGGRKDTEENDSDDLALSTKTLPASHALDVVRLASSLRGHVVSVSLDRSTIVWYPQGAGNYTYMTLRTATLNPILWPIVASVLDNSGSLLAICTDVGYLGLWSLSSRRFMVLTTVNLHGQPPLLFQLKTPDGHGTTNLVIVTAHGHLITVDTHTGHSSSRQLSLSTVFSAALITPPNGGTSVLYANRAGIVRAIALDEAVATTRSLSELGVEFEMKENASRANSIYTVSSLGLVFIARIEEVSIYDFGSRKLLHSLCTEPIRPGSFRVMHSAPRQCTYSAPAVHSLSVAYTNNETGYLVFHTLASGDAPASQICLGRHSKTCHGLDEAQLSTRYVESPGAWEVTDVQYIIGVRRNPADFSPSSSVSCVEVNPPANLRSRSIPVLYSGFDANLSRSTGAQAESETDSWEAFAMSSRGEFSSRPLIPDFPEDEAEGAGSNEQLFVTSCGPIVRLGKRSVAVGFGNTVKILSLGKEWFEGIGEETPRTPGLYKSRSRRGTGRKMQ